MNTKRTILSEKELNLIENAMVKFGIIVTFDQISSLLKETKSLQSVRNLVNRLTKNGWLVRIKKGTYSIANLESRGFAGIPIFKIAQVLVKDSYISFEAAWQYYGMFDQMLKDIASISLKRHKSKEIQGIRYSYVKVKEELFFGWEEERVENYLVKIATKEKVILDLLAFKRNEYSIDLIWEKLKENQNEFDFKSLIKFSLKYSKTVQRIVGFLLDKLLIDSSELYQEIKGSKSSSFMTKESDRFNAKWRLYYPNRFNQD